MGLWRSFEALTSPAAVLTEWRTHLGADFEFASRFLRPADTRAETYPCTRFPPCGCRHELRGGEDGRLVAVCFCEHCLCPPIELRPEDSVVFELDVPRLAQTIGRALGFAEGRCGPVPGTSGSWFCGACSPWNQPVVFSIPNTKDGLLRQTAELLVVLPASFVLLTPTSAMLIPQSESMLQRHGVLHLPLNRHLEIVGREIQVMAPIRPLVDAFIPLVGVRDIVTRSDAPVEGGRGLAREKVVVPDISVRDLKEHLDMRLDKLGEHVADLQQENETLKQRLAEVLGEFARQAEPEFLMMIFAILAAGSMRSAARALTQSPSTFHEKLERFRARGGIYKTLWSVVTLRQRGLGKRSIETFNDLFSGHQPLTEAPNSGLWRELLDGLERMNEGNWQAMRDEFIELLRTEIPDN